MTTPDVRQSRPNVTRIIAASMAFDQDPPVTRSLKAARNAADGIYDALVAAGVLPGNGDAAGHVADGAELPLFPDNGITDPET